MSDDCKLILSTFTGRKTRKKYMPEERRQNLAEPDSPAGTRHL